MAKLPVNCLFTQCSIAVKQPDQFQSSKFMKLFHETSWKSKKVLKTYFVRSSDFVIFIFIMFAQFRLACILHLLFSLKWHKIAL